MTTYNFYTREFFYYKPDGSNPDNQLNYFIDTTDSNGNKIYTNSLAFSTSSTEMFVLYPKYNFTQQIFASSTVAPPSFRVLDTTKTFVEPLNFIFGDLSTTPGTLKLCYDRNVIGSPYDREAYFTNDDWEDSNWTPTSDYSNFKSQVTDFLARGIDNAKNVPVEPLFKLTSWNVYFFMRQIDGDKHFVIFYPGNDAQGTLVQVTI
jgi:hypothetical protein